MRFVIAKNLHRRHLTSSQRAVLALDVLPLLEAEAKERQVEAGKHKQIIAEAGQARDQAAKITNTNRQYVSDAKRIAEKSPYAVWLQLGLQIYQHTDLASRQICRLLNK